MKVVLPACISQTQSAFVPGRLITDNALVAFEMFHTLKNKKKGSKGFYALKLDMTKAYDRVEWHFLEAMMKKMGFHSQWIDYIMRCIKSVSYSIVINGKISNYFKPGRGLRQGDPLSPYLFLICTEGLSAMLAKAQNDGLLKGFKASRNGPSVTHLFFADDSILFARAEKEESKRVKHMLHLYEQHFGQMINVSKPALFFGPNTRNEFKEKNQRPV